MTILGNTFNIILFLSVIGSFFSVLSLLAKKALHISLPLWFGVCGIVMFIFPIIMPTLWLVPPELQVWIHGYQIACLVWLSGVIVFAVYFAARGLLAHRAFRDYSVCTNERVNQIYQNCMQLIGFKKEPKLYFGTLKEPACVITWLHPAIILNKRIIIQLSDDALAIVLCHELMHIKRWHHIFQCIFDAVSILHWANPFVWIAKSDFAANCEMDCDKQTLSVMQGRTTKIEYAKAMLHLMELSSDQSTKKTGGIEALGFLLAKQRMFFILNENVTTRKSLFYVAVLSLFLVAALTFSVYISRGYFYPYPAYDTAPEYPAYNEIFSRD